MEKTPVKIARRCGAVLMAVCALFSSPAVAQLEITDQAGRQVRLDAPAQRLFLSEPGDFVMLAMLVENPAAHVVAWNRWRLDDHTLAQWRNIDPDAFDSIAQLVIDGPQNLSAEALIAQEPDLVVLDHFFGKAHHVVEQLERSGIPVAILTLEPRLTHANPAEGLEKLAVLLGGEQRGREVSEFIRSRRDRVRQRARELESRGVQRPSVLMEPHAGIGPCCLSMGVGRSMGDLVLLAGGRLIGSEIIEEMSGRLGPEYVIAQDPEVYIGTGGRHLEGRGGLALGIGVEEEAAERSLRRAVQRVGLPHVRAVTHGRVHGLWHSGLNIVNLELIAKWLYPKDFEDVNPAATQAELERRFLPLRQHGTFWVTLSGAEQ